MSVTKVSVSLPVSDSLLEDMAPMIHHVAWWTLKLEDWARGHHSPYEEPVIYRRAPWWTVPLAAFALLREASA